MAKLLGRVDCFAALPDKVEVSAKVGDLAVARMENCELDRCFLVGTVTEVDDAGTVRKIATARRRSAWNFDAQIHVGDREKLQGMTAEQIALKLPGQFESFDDAHKAICAILREQASSAQAAT